MELLLELFKSFTLDKAIEVFASLSLYSLPILIFLNAKIQTRRLDLLSKDHNLMNDQLRYMYVKKTLHWILVLILYIASVILKDIQDMANLVFPVMLVYFGTTFGFISIEIKSILSSYKEVKSELYTPILKRFSFWVLVVASAFKAWQLSIGGNFGAPAQIIAILDLASYIFIFGSLFVFVYFDKRKNLVEKALKKSRKIVISMKDNVVRDERYRTRRNREIAKTLRLLKLCIDLIDNKEKVRAVNKNIRELELLLVTSN